MSITCARLSTARAALASLLSAGFTGARRAEAVEGPDPVGVAVTPGRLNPVVPDLIDRGNLECANPQRSLRRDRDSAEKVWLTGTSRAGTLPAQSLQRVIGFVAVVPDHHQLLPEHFVTLGSHATQTIWRSGICFRFAQVFRVESASKREIRMTTDMRTAVICQAATCRRSS